MIRVHKDNFVPKYNAGKWLWNDLTEKFTFQTRTDVEDKNRGSSIDARHAAFNIKEIVFADYIDQVEELIFRQEFNRSETSYDAEVITIQDIKNLVLFLAPIGMLQGSFVDFVHTRIVDKFLTALVIYFEYFLKVLEYLLIRRDEITGKFARIQNLESIEIKQMLAQYLSQYRLLVAREYSKILLGEEDMRRFYHLNTVVNISNTIYDKFLHESFIAFSTQVVWIAMHRKAYGLISLEINRLMRSDHFTQRRNQMALWSIDEQVLYGRNNRRQNYRAQVSPLIQEISNVSQKDLPILWIGERKYRGSDKRIYQLELEFVVPSSQLCLVDVSHGILGHPKRLYNTLLTLNWEMVRTEGYSAQYDPYKIVRQPHLDMPNWREFTGEHLNLEPYYEIRDNNYEMEPELVAKWKKRNRVVAYFKNEGILSDTILECQLECQKLGRKINISRDRIFKEFSLRKSKLRKK